MVQFVRNRTKILLEVLLAAFLRLFGAVVSHDGAHDDETAADEVAAATQATQLTQMTPPPAPPREFQPKTQHRNPTVSTRWPSPPWPPIPILPWRPRSGSAAEPPRSFSRGVRGAGDVRSRLGSVDWGPVADLPISVPVYGQPKMLQSGTPWNKYDPQCMATDFCYWELKLRSTRSTHSL